MSNMVNNAFTRALIWEIGFTIIAFIVVGVILGVVFVVSHGVNMLLEASGYTHPADSGIVFIGILLLALAVEIVHRAWTRAQEGESDD